MTYLFFFLLTLRPVHVQACQSIHILERTRCQRAVHRRGEKALRPPERVGVDPHDAGAIDHVHLPGSDRTRQGGKPAPIHGLRPGQADEPRKQVPRTRFSRTSRGETETGHFEGSLGDACIRYVRANQLEAMSMDFADFCFGINRNVAYAYIQRGLLGPPRIPRLFDPVTTDSCEMVDVWGHSFGETSVQPPFVPGVLDFICDISGMQYDVMTYHLAKGGPTAGSEEDIAVRQGFYLKLLDWRAKLPRQFLSEVVLAPQTSYLRYV